jgi:hypothetical protein
MNTLPLEDAPATIIDALREPERFLRAWRDHGRRAYPISVFVLLLAVTAAATALYGLVMGLPLGAHAALERAVAFTTAAGIAWTLALPTFYILGNMSGLKLDFSTTLLAALLTIHYGALAMLASIPIHLFFAVALPYAAVTYGVNMIIFAGVGLCGADVLVRVIGEVDPESVDFAKLWLVLLGVLGAELFSIAGIFSF